MEFDLVSAYSTRISWGAEFEASSIECHSDSYYNCAECETGAAAVVLVNLKPSTEYTVRACGRDGEIVTGTFQTSDADAPEFTNLYASIVGPDGVYDTTRFEQELHDIFVTNFSQIVKNGDKILANVTVDGVKKQVETVAVRDGSTMKVETDTGIYLPFSYSGSKMQTVTLMKNKDNATLAYDPRDNQFGYCGDMYGVGDKFEMFGKTVIVADGSIVLLFADTVQQTWPFDPSRALAVTGSSGSHFMTNITTNVMNLVGAKTDGETGTTQSSAWIHNTDDSTTNEVSRTVYTIDETSENATISIGVLHTDSGDNKFIEPTLTMGYDQTVISTQDDSDTTASTVINSGGIQFDTSDAAIYFGASQQFRIKYDSTESILQIQSYDSTLLDYVSRAEFSDAS